MKVTGKPKNYWGWVRIGGWIMMAAAALWTVLAAGLQSLGEVRWMMWSSYASFAILDGIELAFVGLLAVLTGAWLEEHTHQTEKQQAVERETEREISEQRQRVIERCQEAIRTELPDPPYEAASVSSHSRAKLHETVREALPHLEGQGKGELLVFLFEQALILGDKPMLDLTRLDFRGAVLQKAQLNHIHLESVELSDARLDEAQLEASQLSRANLKKASLRKANLRGAGLARCNLSGAHMEDANLAGADMKGACLEGAFLMNANLANCALSSLQVTDANFLKADLRGSLGLRVEVLEHAILVDTILPDGRKVTNEKGKAYLHKKEMEMVIDRL